MKRTSNPMSEGFSIKRAKKMKLLTMRCKIFEVGFYNRYRSLDLNFSMSDNHKKLIAMIKEKKRWSKVDVNIDLYLCNSHLFQESRYY